MDSSLQDSSAILNSAELLRARIVEQGYLFFRGLLEPQVIWSLRERVIKALDNIGWLDSSSGSQPRPSLSRKNLGDIDYAEGETAVQALECVHRLAHDPKLLSLMRTIVGDDVFPHPRKFVRLAPPIVFDLDSTTEPHQDFRYCQGAADVFTAWIPIGDCPQEMGGLRVLLGSLHFGLLPIKGVGRHGCGVASLDEDRASWLTTDYKAGDVLIFHSFTVHAAMENRTDCYRLSVDYRYQSANDPICSVELLPAYYPYVPHWSHLVNRWVSTSWIEVPDHLDIIDYLEEIQEVVAPPSRFVQAGVASRVRDLTQ